MPGCRVLWRKGWFAAPCLRYGRSRARNNHGSCGSRKIEEFGCLCERPGTVFEHLDEPVIAMGHSRGAVSSMMVAIKRPDLVRAVILIDPTILAPSLNLLLLMTQKAGLTGFIPIVSGAAHRKRVWPDRQTSLDAYRAKPSFYSWKDGFLEGYVGTVRKIRKAERSHCAANQPGKRDALRCALPMLGAPCRGYEYPLWFSWLAIGRIPTFSGKKIQAQVALCGPSAF